MKVPQFITDDDVKKACQELDISDWTATTQPNVSTEEARTIMNAIEADTTGIDIEDFRTGLEVELEHGKETPEANVTNNHPLLTGLIVLAHMRENLDYYRFLEVAEIEGDLEKAAATKDIARLARSYERLVAARLKLDEAICRQLTI